MFEDCHWSSDPAVIITFLRHHQAPAFMSHHDMKADFAIATIHMMTMTMTAMMEQEVLKRMRTGDECSHCDADFEDDDS